LAQTAPAALASAARLSLDQGHHLGHTWISLTLPGQCKFTTKINSTYDVFFVTSSCVVTLAAARYAGDKTILAFSRDFYQRRIARILPPLVFMLVVASVFCILFVPQAWITRLEARTALAAIFGLSNFVLYLNNDNYFAPAAEFNGFTHTWSLAIEEQFYFFFPILFLVWWRGVGSAAGCVWRKPILPLLCLGSFIYCIWATASDPQAAFYMVPAPFWEFGLGVLIAQWAIAGTPARNPTLRGFLRNGAWLGLVLIALGLMIADEAHFPFPWALLLVVGTSLVLLSLSANKDRSSTAGTSLLNWRPLRAVGLISYALYLWHCALDGWH
jgi:peptidoglycan/LPS O-acetylase OafA/YrhL